MTNPSNLPSGPKPDGRRNNRPPVSGQIKPGEVKNPYGCKGNRGKNTVSRIDQLFLDQAARIVSQDENGDVPADLRLVQEEYLDALVKKDPAARARILGQLALSGIRAEQERRDLLDKIEELFVRKEELRDEFHTAKILSQPPPDVVPHPDHVQFVNGGILFTGPTDRAGRANWEHVKAIIKIAAYLHSKARIAWRRHPTEESERELKAIEAHRRWAMRCVPKGWNWREEIDCRDSWSDFVHETIANWERLS